MQNDKEKHEARNPKYETISKFKFPKLVPMKTGIRNFVLRI